MYRFVRFVFPITTYRRLPLHSRIHVAVLDQMLDKKNGRSKRVGAHQTVKRRGTAAVYAVRPGVMRPNVLAKHNALVEGARTHGTSVGLLA